MPQNDNTLAFELPDDDISLFAFLQAEAKEIDPVIHPAKGKRKSADPFGKENIHNKWEDLSSILLETPNLEEWKIIVSTMSRNFF